MGVGNGPSHVAEQGQVRGQQYHTMLPAFCAQLVIARPPLARLSSCCAICPFLWQRHTPHLKGLWLPQARDINDPGRGFARFHFSDSQKWLHWKPVYLCWKSIPCFRKNASSGEKKNVQSSFPTCNQQISWLTPGPKADSQNSLSGREEGWQGDAGTDWVLDLGSTLCLSGFEELKTGQITERFGPSCQNLSYSS